MVAVAPHSPAPQPFHNQRWLPLYGRPIHNHSQCPKTPYLQPLDVYNPKENTDCEVSKKAPLNLSSGCSRCPTSLFKRVSCKHIKKALKIKWPRVTLNVPGFDQVHQGGNAFHAPTSKVIHGHRAFTDPCHKRRCSENIMTSSLFMLLPAPTNWHGV